MLDTDIYETNIIFNKLIYISDKLKAIRSYSLYIVIYLNTIHVWRDIDTMLHHPLLPPISTPL